MSDHSLLPWRYRPFDHDDWGFIRGLDGYLVAVAREGAPTDDAALNEHRRNKTDPCGPNAAFIVKAVNNHDALVKALEKIAAMDLKGIRADDLGRAARIASEALHDHVGLVKDPS